MFQDTPGRLPWLPELDRRRTWAKFDQTGSRSKTLVSSTKLVTKPVGFQVPCESLGGDTGIRVAVAPPRLRRLRAWQLCLAGRGATARRASVPDVPRLRSERKLIQRL